MIHVHLRKTGILLCRVECSVTPDQVKLVDTVKLTILLLTFCTLF